MDNFKPIAPIKLPAKEDKDVTIEIKSGVTGAIHEAITITGPGFTMPLQVDADAAAPEPTPIIAVTPQRPVGSAPTAAIPVATPTTAPRANVATRRPLRAPQPLQSRPVRRGRIRLSR